MVDVEEGEAPPVGGEEDEEGVNELVDLGEVEDVGVEEDGALCCSFAGGEAEDPGGGGHLRSSGEGAADGHGEREEEDEGIVERGDEAEDQAQRRVGGGPGREETAE